MGRGSVLVIVLAILFSVTREFSSNVHAQLPDCLESDRDALIDFKNGLEDSQNLLSSWQGSNCCQWWGISCENSTGVVVIVSLSLSSDSSWSNGLSKLSGEIRPSLMKLKSLRHLDLSLNTFKFISVPEFFGSLKNLQYLNLSEAGFSGTIPPSLGNLSGLQYLDVSFNYLAVDDLEWVSTLGSLKYLRMNEVDLSAVGLDWVGVLNKLPILTELHLSSCGLSGSIPYPSFVNFTSLAVIDLSYNLFGSKFPDWLVNISSLVSVDISFSSLYGRIPPGLSELPNLQLLNLSGNKKFTTSCFKLFQGSWKRIEVLVLTDNKLHGKLPASIGNMTSLTDFDLSRNNVDGGIPSSIGKLSNLKVFSLYRNNLTGSLPEFLEGTERCASKNPLPRLMYLDLSDNQIVGKLPEWLGQLENLVKLDLGSNLLHGPIPASLGTLQHLTMMALGGNKLNGTLPDSFGQLSELSVFDVSSNQLSGIITEAHFSKLSKLQILLLSFNSFILNISSNWVHPFQLSKLYMSSCHLGPSFPAWLENKKKLLYLDFSNASISGTLPNWFWDVSSNLLLLNISHNQIQGHLPNPFQLFPFASVDLSSNCFKGSIPLPAVDIEMLDLSDNQLSGPIPPKIGEIVSSVIFLSLSGNQITGQIPVSIGQMQFLSVLDLSSNSLTGSIPSQLENCVCLNVLDFRNNSLSGVIPGSLGQLNLLKSLHLSNNMLSGELPLSFQNLSSLETMDLRNNRLKGSIPSWIGGLPVLRILNLRSNAFSGELPPEISDLTSLQVLDLAENDLIGTIPASFGNLKAMVQRKNMTQLVYGNKLLRSGVRVHYEESLVINTEGRSLTYTKTLSLVISLDLSGNNLCGEIPEEITKLFGLLFLNLSRNHISGHIPKSISQLHELLSLDLSGNKFSAAIPQSMCSLTFLSYLNLSDNNLSGMIPYTRQMTTFNESSFAGNPGLCGPPLAVECECEGPGDGGEIKLRIKHDLVDEWFYLSIGLGFAAGILVPYIIIAVKKPWGDAYFGFVDKILERSSWVRNRKSMRQTRQRRHRQRGRGRNT